MTGPYQHNTNPAAQALMAATPSLQLDTMVAELWDAINDLETAALTHEGLSAIVGKLSDVIATGLRSGALKDAPVKRMVAWLDETREMARLLNVPKLRRAITAVANLGRSYQARASGNHDRAFLEAQKASRNCAALPTSYRDVFHWMLGLTAARVGMYELATSELAKAEQATDDAHLHSAARAMLKRTQRTKELGDRRLPVFAHRRSAGEQTSLVDELGRYLYFLVGAYGLTSRQVLKPSSARKIIGGDERYDFLGRKNPLFNAALKLCDLLDPTLDRPTQLKYCDQLLELAPRVPFLEHEWLIYRILEDWLRSKRETERLTYVSWRKNKIIV